MSKDYTARVAIPAPGSMNGGRHSPHNTDMLGYFGVPSDKKTTNCGTPKPSLHIVTRDVGPFNTTGNRYALDSLTRIFAAVKAKDEALYNAVKTEGMTCCRLMRGSTRLWSNHSWGTAIDVYCGASVVPFGSKQTQQGILDLYPYFHNEGWYWGAEFPKADAMHFECSVELLADWHRKGWI